MIGRVVFGLICAIGWCCSPQILQAATPLLEVTTPQARYVGEHLCHNQQLCWLRERDGQIRKIAFSDVREYRPLPNQFRPYSAAEMRDRLRLELGRDFEIKGTTHYLICASPGKAARYGEILEMLYREFYVYLAARNFPITDPGFPLVAIIFPEHKQFAEYAASDGIRNITGLEGYYDLRTNRIALYDPATAQASASVSSTFAASTPMGIAAGRGTLITASLHDTLIHEATHQLAFNVGVHSRIGQSPRWIVEGLAIVFEHPDSRSATRVGQAKHRVNRERYLWFENYRLKRRDERSLPRLIASEEPFTTSTLDAYSEAWALSFFLMETRASLYSRYLKKVASRDPLQEYTVAQRIGDFADSFGAEIPTLEVEYLRFIDQLK